MKPDRPPTSKPLASNQPITPTPELVHGVSIADPVWASLLRRAGVFSGKHIKPDLAEDAVRGLMAGVVVSPMPSYPGSGKPAK